MAKRKRNTTMPTTQPQIQQITPQQTQQGANQASIASVKNEVIFFIDKTKSGINYNCIDKVEKELGGLQNKNDVFLIIHTYGGDVYSAVRIMRIIQQKFKKIRVIIPDFAYSSGTIMSLGSDEIFMDCDAMLGPLDLPMEHPHDGSQISSLDITNTLNNIASICTSVAMKMYSELREDDNKDLKMGKEKAAEIAFDTSTKIIRPIVDKIDPFILPKAVEKKKN